MEMKYTFHVICSTDDNFAQHCGVMIYSLLLSNKKENHIVIHILENSLSQNNKEKLYSIGSFFNQTVCFHHIDSGYMKDLELPPNSLLSLATYFRLFISHIISDPNIKTILYLDCDMIIIKDISEIFDMDLSMYPVAAVRDINNPRNEKHLKALNFSYDDKYFNAGMLLINLNIWRKRNIYKEFLSEAQRIDYSLFQDQDILNSVFRNQWLELPPLWNRFNVVKYEDVFFKNKADELDYIYNPRIIHYASPAARPWMDMHFVPWGKKYEEILKKTPWCGARKQNVETRMRYIQLIKVKYSNILYRSPQLIQNVIMFFIDTIRLLYHIIKYRNLKFF